MKNSTHIPVLLDEVLSNLDPSPDQNFIDATAGEGGHTIAIAKLVRPYGKVLAIEYDSVYMAVVEENIQKQGLEENAEVVNGSYADMAEIAGKKNFPAPDGILFDFGLSSWQLEKSGRGFSFKKSEPLDMRFNPNDESRPTAAEILNSSPKEHLAYIFKEYGEEPRAEKLASAVYEARRQAKLTTTDELVQIIEDTLPGGGRLHPATKIFQALRIAVNAELSNIKDGLTAALQVSKNKTKIAAISFHSLEDRIVKNTFRNWAAAGKGTLINKKVIKPANKEREQNTRSRSAKLRVFEVKK